MCINKTATATAILAHRHFSGTNNIQKMNKIKMVPKPHNNINHVASDTLSQWVETYM